MANQPSIEAAQRSRDRIAAARERGTVPRNIPRRWNLFERAGAVLIYRAVFDFRAECGCGWSASGDDRVRGLALTHGLRCTGAKEQGERRA